MSFNRPFNYSLNSPGYATATIALLSNATNPAAYTTKPSDYMVLLDLSAYPGAGPTITLSTPVDDYPILIRNVAGSGATHNWTIAAPAGCTIENPATPGTFAATVTITTASGGTSWAFDRVNLRFVLYSLGSGGGGGALTSFGADLVNSTATNQWVAAISGNGGLGGTVPLNVNNLQYASGQSTPTYSQATTALTNAQDLVFQPQISSAVNGNPGRFLVALSDPGGSGTVPAFRINQGGNFLAQIGEASNSSTQSALWLIPPTFALSPTAANYSTDVNVNGYLILNSPLGVQIWMFFAGSATNGNAFSNTGIQFFSITQDLGGGNAVIGLTAATTEPTTNPAAGNNVLYGQTAGTSGVAIRGSGGWTEQISAVGNGTINTQLARRRRVAAFLRDSTSGTPITIYTYAMPPSGHITTLEVLLQSTNTVAVGTNSGAAKVAASFQNAAGTVTQIGTTSTIYAHVISAGTVIFTPSGTNVLIQVQDPDAVVRDATAVIDAYEN
jgi:hypothetical protein